jgi:hypothetical protein
MPPAFGRPPAFGVPPTPGPIVHMHTAERPSGWQTAVDIV